MVICPRTHEGVPDTENVGGGSRLPHILIEQNNKYSTRPPVHKGGVALET